MAKKDKTYGEAMRELEEIMNHIESDELEIDVLMQEVKKASSLIRECKEKLYKTNSEIQKILDEIDE